MKVAEEARAGLFVAEDEAAEIAGEALDAHAERGEIEVRLAGEKALLDEEFLHADGGIGAVRAGAHVDGEQSVLAGDGVVDVELRRDFEFEIDGFEAGAAAEEVEADAEILLEEGLLAAAEEVELAGVGGTRDGWHGDTAPLPRWSH